MIDTLTRTATLALVGAMLAGAHAWNSEPVRTGLRPNAPASPADAPAATQADTPSGSDDAADQAAAASKAAAAPGPVYDPAQIELRLDVVAMLWQEGTGQFLDARKPEEFRAGHIPGAFFLPPDAFDEGRPEALDFLDTSMPAVVYCIGGDCHDAENVAISLQDWGFTSVHIFVDGFPAWESSGYEVSTGPDPLGMPEDD